MWNSLLPTIITLRDAVIAYAKTLIDIFTSSIADHLQNAPSWIGWVSALIPEALLSMSIFEIMTGSFVVLIFIVYIVKIINPIS